MYVNARPLTKPTATGITIPNPLTPSAPTAMQGHLPPGFRFFPTEEELVSFYLRHKLESSRTDLHRVIPVIDIYDLEPWHLPKFSGELCRGDPEQWFFFTPRQEREAHGGRTNRTTSCGYWKATGSPSYVYSSDNRIVGVKKTMVFYRGKAPTGRKTKWKMNEYRAVEEESSPPTGGVSLNLRQEFSLCRVYVVSGTFRAFDRRPLAGESGDELFMNAKPVETGSSTRTDGSYSAGPGVELPSMAGSSSWAMETPWDWEQLDWQ